MNWFKARRLDYIDATISSGQWLSMSDIMEAFDISRQQAHADLSAYRAACPPNHLRYDASRHGYRLSDGRKKATRRRPVDAATSTVLLAILGRRTVPAIRADDPAAMEAA